MDALWWPAEGESLCDGHVCSDIYDTYNKIQPVEEIFQAKTNGVCVKHNYRVHNIPKKTIKIMRFFYIEFKIISLLFNQPLLEKL